MIRWAEDKRQPNWSNVDDLLCQIQNLSFRDAVDLKARWDKLWKEGPQEDDDEGGSGVREPRKPQSPRPSRSVSIPMDKTDKEMEAQTYALALQHVVYLDEVKAHKCEE